MLYTIRHTTRFRYSLPISESIMEVRIQPRSEGNQHCLDFQLHTTPRAHIMSYRGEFGNRVHYFDIPNSHTQLAITAASLVTMQAPPPVPAALSPQAWEELDALTANDEFWDSLKPSHFARPTEPLFALITELDMRRRDDPLSVLRNLNTALYKTFEYVPQSTRVDSPIDDALLLRKGVCQDYAHIMITLVRQLGIPCRYVSGYLFQQNRSLERSPSDAMHAWVEAYLPDLGWVGFDPTNNTLADERHVRVAVGRDYADVPPTHGVFRGNAQSELSVTVRFAPSDVTFIEELPVEPTWTPAPYEGNERDQVQQQIMPHQQ
jgi:transglutaminase-like putative cysteine protease